MKKTSKMKVKDLGIKQMQMPSSHTKADGKSCPCASCACGCANWGLTLVRIVVGVMFVLHGIQKIMHIAMIQGFFASVGAGAWLAWPVALVETLAGIALVLGFWTRFAGYLLGLDMASAIVFVDLKFGWVNWLFVAAIVVASLALLWMQNRRWAGWLLGIALGIIVLGSFWLQIAGGISPKAGLEVELMYMVAGYLIAWNGPGRISMHETCECCN